MKFIFVPQGNSWVGPISIKTWRHITITYAAFNDYSEANNLSTSIVFYKNIFMFWNL